MKCYACGAELEADMFKDEPSTYQFDNALWIGFHGGYGMFVDNIEARLPNNTEDRWLRDKDGEYFLGEVCKCNANPESPMEYHELSCPRRNPIDNPLWEPTYNQERMLPGQPDYECVICHECAHAACRALPWLDRLLEPHRSHAHKGWYHDANPNHRGWDYEPHD